jgi:parallel beta-helix repeat protein
VQIRPPVPKLSFQLSIFALIALVCALALPALASGENFVVDGTGDQEDSEPGLGGCLTASGKCTLRAAIEEANSAFGIPDEITFSAAVFQGQNADTISPGMALPPIVDAVTIDGESGPCATAAAIEGPCVGIDGFGLEVEGDKVTIEGLSLTNAIVGIRVFGGSAGFAALDNWVGTKLNGSAGVNTTAIRVSSGGLAGSSEEATIAANQIQAGSELGSGLGIVQNGFGASIIGNHIAAAVVGIETSGPVGSQGNLVEGNLVEGSELAGIKVENNDNELFGNEVIGSGAAGVLIKEDFLEPPTGNVVGGNSPSDENVISGTRDDAIAIEGAEATVSEVARNRGSENGGLFIDLGGDGEANPSGGPNGGIQPPQIVAATQTTTSGAGAEPGARIRVFRKAGPEAGELESFLAETIADSGGNWKVGYAALPGGTIVAATQTSVAGGTSELTMSAVSGVPGGGGGGGGGSNGVPCLLSSGCGPPPGNPRPFPKTTIVKGPKKKSHSRTARFKFDSDQSGSTFQCRLDGRRFGKCTSPRKYENLKPGKHRFEVRAVGSSGEVDPTPAMRKFQILA